MESKKMKYSKKRLSKALDSIREGKLKICEAAKVYQIPRQTLSDKIRGRRPPGYCRPGPQAVLGTDVESRIENWLLNNVKYGFSSSREGIEFSVKHIIDQIPESARSSIPFKNNTPGKGWFNSFRKRHPQVMLHLDQNASTKKSLITKNDLRVWYDNVKLILEEHNSSSVLQDCNRLWVMNELVVAFNQDRSVSLLEKKRSQKLASKSYSFNTFTIFLSANAAGELAPPLIITKSTQLFDRLANIVSGKWGALSSESCLLTSETFYEYFTNIFYPQLIENNITFPVVVFVDEDFLCTSLPLTEFCQSNNIIFLAMPKNASQFLNPLNTANGFPLDVLKIQGSSKLSYDSTTNHPIVSLVEDILSNVTVKPYIVEKFRSCNIFPFNYLEDESDDEQITPDNKNNEEQSPLMDYFKSKIPAEVLTQFQNCKSRNIPWSGSKKYVALYNFWLKACDELILHESCDDDSENSSHSSECEMFDDFILEEEIEID